MHNDILDLRAFYDSPLGHMARRTIRRRLRALWPDVRRDVILGLGYATPYLGPFRDEAERTIALMPASQGCTPWPRQGAKRVALTEEGELPLPDYSVDRVILVHGLETTELRQQLFAEIWRVMSSTGKLIVVVPNRRGLWARSDRTPFGHGHPYSAGQLRRVLKEYEFVPQRLDRALFVPPLRTRLFLGAAPAWEQVGRRWFEGFGGVLLLEASKQVYRVAGTRSRARVARPVLMPRPQVAGRLAEPAVARRPADAPEPPAPALAAE
jgi:SAM-dependent methyltransferase